jgi:hypothetical protein
MRGHEMKRILSTILLSVLTLSLLGCRNEISETAYNDFITKLEEMDFSVISEDVDEDILQGERKWLTINETENISVYFYESNAKMEKDASFIDAGGSSYNNGKEAVEISWVSFPHFYKTENIIVLYVGEDTALIHALEEIIGDQFAGYTE